MSLSAISRAAAWLYALLVAYLFTAPLSPQSQYISVARFVLGPEFSIRDLAENWLLGIPLGLCCGAAAILSGHRLLSAAAPLATIVLVIVLPMEILQHWMPTRSASLPDAIMVLIGGFSAILGLWCVRTQIVLATTYIDQSRDGLRYLLLFVWPVYFWIPTRLQLDNNPFRTGITPITQFSAEWVLVSHALIVAGGWMVAFSLLPRQQTVRFMTLLVIFSWAGLVLAPGRALSWGSIFGGIAAILLYSSAKGHNRLISATIIVIIGGLLTHLYTLQPIGRTDIFWVPFAEFGDLRKLEIAVITLGENYALMALPMLFTLHYSENKREWAVSLLAVISIMAVIEASGYVFGRGGNTTSYFVVAIGALFGWLQLARNTKLGPTTTHQPLSAGSRRNTEQSKTEPT